MPRALTVNTVQHLVQCICVCSIVVTTNSGYSLSTISRLDLMIEKLRISCEVREFLMNIYTTRSGGQSPASHARRSSSMPVQSPQGLWSAHWHWDRLFWVLWLSISFILSILHALSSPCYCYKKAHAFSNTAVLCQMPEKSWTGRHCRILSRQADRWTYNTFIVKWEVNLFDFRRPPRCKLDIRSSGMLSSLDW